MLDYLYVILGKEEQLVKSTSPKTLAILFALQLPLVSHAAVITYTDIYTNNMTTTGVGTLATGDVAIESGIRSFDSSLGTLQDISVTINGTLHFNGVHGANFTPGPFGVPLPTPFQSTSTYELNITGLAGELFSLANPIGLTSVALAPGGPASTPFSFTSQFSKTFDFNTAIGMFLPAGQSCNGGNCTPVTGISGTLESFMTDNLLVDQMLFVYGLQVQELPRTVSAPSTWNVNSLISISTTYVFTEPGPGPGPAPVPEPTTLGLILAGILGLMGRANRRRWLA